MAFTLRVTSGDGSTEAFSFDDGEARLGRTADNDVVIKDPSSSRSHARIFEEDGRCFVEDLKSANGTRHNGRPVKVPAELKHGDTVSIGDVSIEVELAFGNDTVMAPPDSTVDEVDDLAEATQDPNSTILKPARAPAAIVRRPAEAPSGTLEEDVPDNQTKNFEVPPPKALQRRPETPAASGRRSRVDVPATRPSRTGAAISRAPAQSDDAPVVSAAERARERRELQKSSSGRAQLLWADLPPPARIALGIVGSLMVLGVLGGGIYAMVPKKKQTRPETEVLRPNAEPLEEVYGLGDEVEFERPDMKSFTFVVQSPTDVVGVLHYQAADSSKDEVSIELNGAQLGTVPPDTLDVDNRELEQVLPATQLRLNDPNELVFDNINNPPQRDTWRVWNVWVEIIPVPRMSAEDAGRRAKGDLDRASKLYADRQVGAMNLFRSWKLYREAWLVLEATPDRPTELLDTARTRMREIRPELDRKCQAMRVDFKKELNKKDPKYEVLRAILLDVGNHFEKEHPCLGWSRSVMRSLDEY